MARRMFVRFPALGVSPNEIRDQIAVMHGKRPGDIKAHFAKLHALSEARRAGRESSHADVSPFIGRCFHADWRDVIPSLPDGSIKIINADPPFGGYVWQGEGGYLSSRSGSSGLRTDSDANTDAEATYRFIASLYDADNFRFDALVTWLRKHVELP